MKRQSQYFIHRFPQGYSAIRFGTISDFRDVEDQLAERASLPAVKPFVSGIRNSD